MKLEWTLFGILYTWIVLADDSNGLCSIDLQELSITNHQGFIDYPGGGKEYPANQTCTWLFPATGRQILRFTFDYVDIRGGRSCDDHLVLPDGKVRCTNVNTTRSYMYVKTNEANCSDDSTFVSTNWPYPSLTFVSDASDSGLGFKLSFSIEDGLCTDYTTTTSSKTSEVSTTGPSPIPPTVPVGLIVGLSFGGVLILVLAGVGFIFCRSRCDHTERPLPKIPTETESHIKPVTYESIRKPNDEAEYITPNDARKYCHSNEVIKIKPDAVGIYENSDVDNIDVSKLCQRNETLQTRENHDNESTESGYMAPISVVQPVYLDLNEGSQIP
uniref:CUB domain-containing protein n=1 Tax=Ciona savignyi TaxID=51511 RepID=H2YLM7_CIOSA